MIVVPKQSTTESAAFTASEITAMSSAKQTLVISHQPKMTLSHWSPDVSHMILSKKMLKGLGESKRPCQAPTVVLTSLLCCH